MPFGINLVFKQPLMVLQKSKPGARKKGGTLLKTCFAMIVKKVIKFKTK